jgi:hypothetical protein
MKVTAVNGDDVTAGGVTGPGAGDVLPAASTTVTVNTQHVVDTDFDGDKLEMIAVVSPVRGHFDFQDSGGLSLEARELEANDPWTWATNIGVTNPLSGNAVDSLMLSIGDTTAAKTVKVALVYNSDQ